MAFDLPALLQAKRLTGLMVHLRQTAAQFDMRGGVLFDGERLLALMEATAPALAGLLAKLLQGAPAQAAGLQLRAQFAQALVGLPCPAWRLGFVAPEQLDGCWACAEQAHTTSRRLSEGGVPRAEQPTEGPMAARPENQPAPPPETPAALFLALLASAQLD